MRKSANYETDNGVIQVRPNVDENGELTYVTIFTPSSKVHINVELVDEMLEILSAIVQRYILKEEIEFK